MAGRPRYTAADVPYLLKRDAMANNAARSRIEQGRLTRLHDRYEDDDDPAFLQYGHTRREEDPRRANSGVAPRDRGFYPPPEPRYHDLYSLEPGRCAHSYPGRRPSYSADDESDFDRHRRHSIRGPPVYDAAGERPVFDDGRLGSFRGCGLGNDQLPFHARDMETRDFDEETLRATDPDLRYSHPPLGPLGSYDIGLDHSSDLESRARPSICPSLYNYYDDFDLEPRRNVRDFGRAGAHTFRQFYPEYHFDDDNLDKNSRKNRQSHRPRRARHQSDFDLRFLEDDSEDEISTKSRVPTAAERRRGDFLVRRHGGLDAEELDAGDRAQDRWEAQVEKRYTEEDFDMEETARGRRDRRSRKPRTTRPDRAAILSDVDLEDFPRARRGISFRPRQPGRRRSPRRNPRVNVNVDRSAGRTRTRRAPLPYDSVTPTQVADDAHRPPVAAAAAGNADHYLVSAALSPRGDRRPLVAAVVDDTPKGVVGQVPHGQRHVQGPIVQAKNKGTAHDGTRITINPKNHVSTPLRASVHSAHALPTEESDDGHSDSSDSGIDTPDSGYETSCPDDDNANGDVLQSFIHISL